MTQKLKKFVNLREELLKNSRQIFLNLLLINDWCFDENIKKVQASTEIISCISKCIYLLLITDCSFDERINKLLASAEIFTWILK